MKNPNRHQSSNEDDDNVPIPVDTSGFLAEMHAQAQAQAQAAHEVNRHDKKVKDDNAIGEDDDSDAETNKNPKTTEVAPQRRNVARSLKDIFKANSFTSRIRPDRSIDQGPDPVEAGVPGADQYLPEDPHAASGEAATGSDEEPVVVATETATPPPVNTELDDEARQPETSEQPTGSQEEVPHSPNPDEEAPSPEPSAPAPPAPPTPPARRSDASSGDSGGGQPPVSPPTGNGGGGGGSAANYLPLTPPAGSAYNHVPAVVERRGGVAGPVAAFLAANYLSRRRHRRTKKEAKKIREEIKDTQAQQSIEGRRLRSIEDSIRNRPAAPVPVQPKPRPKTESATPVFPPPDSRPTKVSEILSATPLAEKQQVLPAEKQPPADAPVPVQPLKPVERATPKIEKPIKPPTTEKLATPPAPASEYIAAHQRAVDLRELRRKQAEQIHIEQAVAAEKQAPSITEKTEYRPRKENKEPANVPASFPQASNPIVSPAPSRPQASIVSASQQLPPVRPTNSPSMKSPSLPQQDEIYKRAMRNGSLVGLAIIVLGVLAYLIVG